MVSLTLKMSRFVSKIILKTFFFNHNVFFLSFNPFNSSGLTISSWLSVEQGMDIARIKDVSGTEKVLLQTRHT